MIVCLCIATCLRDSFCILLPHLFAACFAARCQSAKVGSNFYFYIYCGGNTNRSIDGTVNMFTVRVVAVTGSVKYGVNGIAVDGVKAC